MFKIEFQKNINNESKYIRMQLCIQEILQEDFTIFLNKVGKILSYLNIDSINITTEMKEE